MPLCNDPPSSCEIAVVRNSGVQQLVGAGQPKLVLGISTFGCNFADICNSEKHQDRGTVVQAAAYPTRDGPTSQLDFRQQVGSSTYDGGNMHAYEPSSLVTSGAGISNAQQCKYKQNTLAAQTQLGMRQEHGSDRANRYAVRHSVGC